MFGSLSNILILWIQLCDKNNLTFVDFCDKNLLNSSFKMLFKPAKGSVNNIFQDSFDKMLSQLFTRDRSYISIKADR